MLFKIMAFELNVELGGNLQRFIEIDDLTNILQMLKYSCESIL